MGETEERQRGGGDGEGGKVKQKNILITIFTAKSVNRSMLLACLSDTTNYKMTCACEDGMWRVCFVRVRVFVHVCV